MNRILKEETYPDGSPRIRETLLADGKTIVKEAWYPSGVDPGNPPAQEYKYNIVNGQEHGLQEIWYENGQRWSKHNYVDGQKHGLEEGWYWDGQQWYKQNFVNGKRHGLQECWYPSGVDPGDPVAQRGGQQYYKWNYVNGTAAWCSGELDAGWSTVL